MGKKKNQWEMWLSVSLLLFFLGLCYWTSPIRELQQIRWRFVGFSQGPRAQIIGDSPTYQSVNTRVAICLVGGARSFELTGPSIKRHLLDAYEDADIFVHTPIDSNVHKLTLLDGRPHLAAIRLFKPNRINETQLTRKVLTPKGSPNGIQGLLQYFRLVEGCLNMIEEYETLHNFKYGWIIRTRVDGFWNAPMPPINAFNPSFYHVPYGSGYGGLNDRLGVGTRNLSWIALSRLSLLPKIYEFGHRGLYSETAFLAQFSVSGVKVQFRTFPFCVLSTRKYGWPPRKYGVPVVSIKSKGPLNGAKCRPCTPVVVGELAKKLADGIDRSTSWIGPTEDAQLCNATQGWESQWEKVYDEVVGPEEAQVRRKIGDRTTTECINDVQHFQRQWEKWDAPSAQILCERFSEGAKELRR